MRKYEIDHEWAKARYAYKQLKQKIEALEEFERRGELSDRQLLIDAYNEEIQMVKDTNPELALTRAVWLLGDCLDQIDTERLELKQLDALNGCICGFAEVFLWREDRSREFRVLMDYLDRLKRLKRRHERKMLNRYRTEGSFDDPEMDRILREEMANWFGAMMYGEAEEAEEEEEEEEDALSADWGAADALREARKIYDSCAALLGGKR